MSDSSAVERAVDQLPLDSGIVRLEWPKPLTMEDLEDFEYWLESVRRRTRRWAEEHAAKHKESDDE